MPAGAKQIASGIAGPSPSYFWTRITYNFNQSSGIWLTRELGFTSGSNFQGTRFTSSWYKRGTYAQLYSDPSSFTQNTTVCSLANISWGTTYQFGGGTPTSADTSTNFYCAAGYYSGAHSIATSTFYFRPWKVTFNVNGGSWGANVRLNNANYTGSNYAIMAVRQAFYNDMSTDIPTRTGYTFKGWYTATSGGTQVYNASGKAVVDNVYWEPSASDSSVAVWCYEGNVTLYAQWTPKTYTVSFNANGGSVSTTSKTVTYASTYGTLPTPTLTGHTFNGWYTAASGGTKITSSSTVSITSAQTLYAHWSANTYTITYKANGGTGSDQTQTATYGTSWTTKEAVFTRFGYVQTSWNTASDGSGTKYSLSTAQTSSQLSNVTLYAIWERRNVAQYYVDTSTKKPVCADYYDSTTQTWKPLIGYVYNGSEWMPILHVGQISVGQIGGGSGIG